ncbi:MAG: hydrogenase accessory protein [Dinoroseobacter sp.]|nr:hydrogenase accessory protein [Dinoroseobacter sp.]
MTHPLIARLTDEIGWPGLSNASDVAEFVSRPGVHCLFLPGDPAKNLETTDAAVILPEIVQSFQGKFDCAVVGDEIEYKVREDAGVFKTPLLIFFRDGHQLGTIPKVRDWDDYLNRVTHFLSLTPEGAA